MCKMESQILTCLQPEDSSWPRHVLSTVPSYKWFPLMHPPLCGQSSFPDQADQTMRASDEKRGRETLEHYGDRGV